MVTVWRHVPASIIGMVGVSHDREYEAFEEHLGWLDAMGMQVERTDPASASTDAPPCAEARRAMAALGEGCLPLILVNDTIVSQGSYLSRAALAHAVGLHSHPCTP